jgi:hypothetical protein
MEAAPGGASARSNPAGFAQTTDALVPLMQRICWQGLASKPLTGSGLQLHSMLQRRCV